MALMNKRVVMFFVVMALMLASMKTCYAKIHKVGDGKGWTNLHHVNYTNWATSRTFEYGDRVVFLYNRHHSNVMQVSREHYHSCNSTSPYLTYNSGRDTIFIPKKPVHYYFISGVARHCEAGQKVDIRHAPHQNIAGNAVPTPLKSPLVTDYAAAAAAAAVPTPESSRGHISKELGMGVVLFAVVAAGLLF